MHSAAFNVMTATVIRGWLFTPTTRRAKTTSVGSFCALDSSLELQPSTGLIPNVICLI